METMETIIVETAENMRNTADSMETTIETMETTRKLGASQLD